MDDVSCIIRQGLVSTTSGQKSRLDWDMTGKFHPPKDFFGIISKVWLSKITVRKCFGLHDRTCYRFTRFTPNQLPDDARPPSHHSSAIGRHLSRNGRLGLTFMLFVFRLTCTCDCEIKFMPLMSSTCLCYLCHASFDRAWQVLRLGRNWDSSEIWLGILIHPKTFGDYQ